MAFFIPSISDRYENGYMGRVYAKAGTDEILVFKSDKTLQCDRNALEYVGYGSYATDQNGENSLVHEKYNIIDF